MIQFTKRALAASTLLLMAGGASAAYAQSPPLQAAPQAARGASVPLQICEALVGTEITAQQIGLPTRGATVTSAKRMEVSEQTVRNGDTVLPINAHCQLQGQILGVTEGAPPINFNINLPLVWNGTVLHSGNGGLGGAVGTAPGMKGSGMIDPESPARPYRLNTGYVTFGSDEGHARGDFAFYGNDEAMRNWAGDFVKKARDVALPLITAAYATAPRRIYMTGESAGGRETVMAAQRFALDYDGFIATSPVLYWNINHIADNVTRSLLIDAWIDEAAIKTIADATRAACDENDGLKDGVVARYMQCDMPTETLRCPDGAVGVGCLSDGQVAALDQLRFGWDIPAGIKVPYGLTRFPGYGITGDEDGVRYQYNFYPIGSVQPSRDLPPGLGTERGVGAILNFGSVWIRHAIAQDPTFNPYNFDPLPYAPRIRYLTEIFEAMNPNLSELERTGAKLIIYEPSADNAAGLPPIADYYDRVVDHMGREGTDEVMRFYVGPGGGHNVTGISHVDLLSVMEAWVDDGQTPPDALRAEQVDAVTLELSRSMPACRYPAYAQYKGSGSLDVFESFTCQARPEFEDGE